MKKIFLLGLTLFIFTRSINAQIVWDGGGTTNDFSEAANWLFNVVPAATDNVVFNGLISSKNCNFDVPINLVDLNILSSYSGTISGLSSFIYLTGNFSQAGGTFISTNTDFGIEGNFSFSGGTFNHGGGNVTMNVGGAFTRSISGSVTFDSLTVNPIGSTSDRILNFGTSTAKYLIFTSGGTATRLTSLQGNIDITSQMEVTGTNIGVPGSNTGVISFIGAGPITLTGAGAAARNKLPNVVINTTGTVTMTGHINVQGNWTATQGTILNSGTSIVNFYGANSAVSGNAAFNSITAQTGASVTFPANEVLISGSLSKAGTGAFVYPAACALGLNGTSTQNINVANTSLLAITCYSNSTTRAIGITGPVDITDSLKLGNNALLTITSGLTLKATSTKKARFALLGTGATITGNVTVETNIANSLSDWRMLGIAGVSGQLLSSWDTYSVNPNGLPMTCEGCYYDVMGIGSYFESVQGWTETNNSYDTLITASTPLTPGRGFWVYVGNSAHTDITLSNTGALVTGNVPVAVTKSDFAADPSMDNFNLVANPYACPISWDRVKNSNNSRVQAAIYFYGEGGDNSYTSGSGGTSGNIINGAIPAGQAFYVEARNNGNMNFTEAHKILDNTGDIWKPATTLQNFRLNIAGAADKDDALINFNANATPFFDGDYDAHKLFTAPGYIGYPGAYDKFTSISTKDPFNWDYSIQTFPLLTNSLTVPVLARVSASGSYTISATDFQNFTSCVGLRDKTTNITHDLRQSDYVFNISDSTAVPRFELVLCRDESIDLTGIAETNTSSNAILINQNEEGAVIKTAFAQNTKATISLYNIVGQKLMEDVKIEGTATVTNLNINLHNQVVLIRVVTDKESSTKKMVLH